MKERERPLPGEIPLETEGLIQIGLVVLALLAGIRIFGDRLAPPASAAAPLEFEAPLEVSPDDTCP